MAKQKVKLVLLMLLFLVPLVAAYLLVYLDFRPVGGANYGGLVDPARPVQDDTGLRTLDGGTFRFGVEDRKWTLLFLGDTRCDDNCERNLYKIQQVRLTQERNMGRVRSVVVLPAGTPRPEIENISGTYPGIIIVLAQADGYAGLVDQFRHGDDPNLQGAGRVYIVDPIGNIMMSYPSEADPGGIRKDLKRLLKISQLG
ncbi:hypothetical protein N9H39_08350 [Gammaproteobacteria bacterium]|nr:hypothetical protein [Gammaproteobacteria bacterium]